MMQKWIGLLVMMAVIALASGCKPKEADAQIQRVSKPVGGYVQMTFQLEDGQSIKTQVNSASTALVRINKFIRSDGGKMRLTGSIKVIEHEMEHTKFHIRMMLYKNSIPNGSFNFPVAVSRSKKLEFNLGSGMMLYAHFK